LVFCSFQFISVQYNGLRMQLGWRDKEYVQKFRVETPWKMRTLSTDREIRECIQINLRNVVCEDVSWLIILSNGGGGL
jgi:hypothetical protein